MFIDNKTAQTLLETNRQYQLFPQRKIFSRRNREYSPDKAERLAIADLAFANRLDDILKEIEQIEPSRIERLRGLEKVVAVDIGCRYMPYALPLQTLLSSINSNTILYGVDNDLDVAANFDTEMGDNGDICFLRGYAEDLSTLLAEHGERKADILFLFNPYPASSFPALNEIDDSVIKDAILIGTADGFDSQARGHYERGLNRNNFQILIVKDNPFGKLCWKYNYSPWYVADPEAA